MHESLIKRAEEYLELLQSIDEACDSGFSGVFLPHAKLIRDLLTALKQTNPRGMSDMETDTEILKNARFLAERLIINGDVDANNDSMDGVRALYQCLHSLQVTGYQCAAIRKLEQQTQTNEEK